MKPIFQQQQKSKQRYTHKKKTAKLQFSSSCASLGESVFHTNLLPINLNITYQTFLLYFSKRENQKSSSYTKQLREGKWNRSHARPRGWRVDTDARVFKIVDSFFIYYIKLKLPRSGNRTEHGKHTKSNGGKQKRRLYGEI